MAEDSQSLFRESATVQSEQTADNTTSNSYAGSIVCCICDISWEVYDAFSSGLSGLLR
jgi:hypothetical protein